MVDTPRQLSELLTIFADGQPDASITPQDMRDFVVSVGSWSAYLATGSTNARALADRAADTFNVRDWGMLPSASAATNLTALQALAAAVNALSGTGAIVKIPAGTYNVAEGTVTFTGSGITICGDGLGATLLLTNQATLDFLVMKPLRTAVYAAGVHLRDFTIVNSPNLATAGSLVKLNRLSYSGIDHVRIDGGFVNLDAIGPLLLQVTNVFASGTNNNAGSTVAKFGRDATTVATSAQTTSGTVLLFSNTSGIYKGDTVSGTNIHAGSTVSSIVENVSVTLSAAVDGTVASSANILFTGPSSAGTKLATCEFRGTNVYTQALHVRQADGLQITNSHIGFSTYGMVVEPADTAARINGIYVSNSDFDNNTTYGIHFKPRAAYAGSNVMHCFANCVIQTAVTGLYVEDTSLADLRITGCEAMLCTAHGMNFQGGSHLTIAGCMFELNNQSASTYPHILIGGATSYVAISGTSFHAGTVGSVPYNITLADTSNHIAIGHNVYQGATTANISVTTSGTDYHIAQGASDQSTDLWSWNVVRTSATQRTIKVDDGSTLFTTRTFAANSVECVLMESRPSGGAGAQLLTSGGSNVNLSVYAAGSGTLTLGTSTNATTLGGSSVTLTNGTLRLTVGAGLVAAGTTRADALALTKQVNTLGTVASGTGVVLPTGVVGMIVDIFNNGANILKVYASGSETIDGTAGSTGVNLTNAKRCRYYFTATNTWISAQLGVTSA